MKSFLEIKNRYFFGSILIIWVLGLYFSKFDVEWFIDSSEIFKFPEFIMNSIILLWLIQKTIKSYINNNLFIFVILCLFWFLFTIRLVKRFILPLF